jgi:hypothetical protein
VEVSIIMAWLPKLKNALEWLRLAIFVGDLLIAMASWKAVKKLLTYVPHVSEDWASIIAWLAAALILFALVWWQQRSKSEQKQGIQKATNALTTTSPGNFDTAEFFKNAYSSQFKEETENNIRAAAVQNQPSDREGFYVKLIAIGLNSYMYDMAWAYIYKSQILLLMELNRKIMPVAEVKAYYDKAASDHPILYARYSFDQWMAFMKSHILLIQHPSGMVEITVRGKDFLKYLTHWGRYPDDRNF